MMEYLEKAESFEGFLRDLNDALVPHFPSLPTRPPRHVFCQIVGLPRSGTTILLQLLARTGLVGYPSNVMAHYWRVPVVGAKLHRQLAQSHPTVSFRSLAGRTREPLDPHEFGYFWRDALGHSENTLQPDRKGWEWSALQDALDAICEAFDAPTVHKNFLALHHAPEMRRHLERSKFLVVSRKPKDVATSLWSVRQRIDVPDEEVFGIDPGVSGQGDLVDRIVRQVAALEGARADLVEGACGDVLVVNYDDLCEAPRRVVSDALHFIGVEDAWRGLDEVPSELSKGAARGAIPEDVITRFERAFPED